MEQLETLDSLETPVEIKRNTFITVLCILTWVGCGVMLIYYIFLYSMMHTMWEVMGRFDIDGVSSSIANVYRWQLIYYIVAATCIIPCLVGSLMIWRMKVSGFVIYLIGEAIPVLFSFFIAFNGREMGFSNMITSILSAVVPIGFIVMYAINLKYMRVPKDDGFN